MVGTYLGRYEEQKKKEEKERKEKSKSLRLPKVQESHMYQDRRTTDDVVVRCLPMSQICRLFNESDIDQTFTLNARRRRRFFLLCGCWCWWCFFGGCVARWWWW